MRAAGIAGAVAMLAAAGLARADGAADRAAVETVVESVAAFADRGEFEALERLYAAEVRVDYTSLGGGEPAVVAAADLMAQWAAVLPGFDRTRHGLGPVSAAVEGDTARAEAEVVADHWLGTERWRVAGRYAYELARADGEWRITGHVFTLTAEEGDRGLLARAEEAARADPAPFTLRRQARDAVLAFLGGLEDKDMDRVDGVWAEDAVQEMPYAPPGFPARVEGRAALIAHYAAWPQVSGAARFTDGIRFHDTLDPRVVVAEFHGVTEITTTGRTYDQRYIGVFLVEDGRIALFREYFDPTVFVRAFGLDEGGAVRPEP